MRLPTHGLLLLSLSGCAVVGPNFAAGASGGDDAYGDEVQSDRRRMTRSRRREAAVSFREDLAGEWWTLFDHPSSMRSFARRC